MQKLRYLIWIYRAKISLVAVSMAVIKDILLSVSAAEVPVCRALRSPCIIRRIVYVSGFFFFFFFCVLYCVQLQSKR